MVDQSDQAGFPAQRGAITDRREQCGLLASPVALLFHWGRSTLSATRICQKTLFNGDRAVDGLKRSLEHAIRELQDMPAPARPNPPVTRNMPPLQNTRSAPPAANSIEAALASAPSVSPHYVPPPPPAPAPPKTASSHGMRTVRADPGSRKPEQPALRPLMHTAAKPIMTGTSLALSSAANSGGKPIANIKIGALSGEGIGDLADEVALKAKKLRDNIWRWATIGISCAGGLASGWLGSTVSDQSNGLIQSSVQTIVGKASENMAGVIPPVALKMVRTGLSDRGAADAPGQMIGKTDRAVPLDDNLCTVLELDRGTGLTLAKPCKAIKTADFNSTLGKADLFETPQ